MFAGISLAAVFVVAASATMEADRKEREKELTAAAKLCSDSIRDRLVKHCSQGWFLDECSSLRFTCTLQSAMGLREYEVACSVRDGNEYETTVKGASTSCLAESPERIAYEEKLVRQAATSSWGEAVCGKQPREMSCAELRQILKGLENTKPASLTLPLALQKLSDYFSKQTRSFFKKNCASIVRKDKKLQVTCSQSSSTPAYATAVITCEGDQQNKLTLEEIVNGYESSGKPVQATKSHAALMALLCPSPPSPEFRLTTAKGLQDGINAAIRRVVWTEEIKKMQ